MSLLADRILYKKNWGDTRAGVKLEFDIVGHQLGEVSRKMYGARVVSLDDATAAFAYELSLGLNPETVMDSLQYFRLPTQRMWFEFRRDAFLPETPPGHTGFLLEKTSEEGFSIMLVDEETREVGTYMTGSLIKFFFSINEAETLAMNNPLNLSFRQRTFYALGMQYEPGSDLDKLSSNAELMSNDPWRLFSQHVEFDFADPKYDRHPSLRGDVTTMYLQELAGTIRHVLAILLLYHFPPVERYVREPRKGRRIVNGKSRPYFSFEEISVRFPKRKPVNPYKWVRNGLPKPEHRKRAHDVDGHWRRLRALTDAELRDLGRPRASLAPHEFFKYTWVRAHQRGDSSLGFSIKRKRIIS